MPKTKATSKVAAAKHNRTLRTVAASNPAVIERSKANAKQTAQIGVIAYIMQMLRTAKSKKQLRTFAELHESMCAYFPQRKASGLAITLRAQLSRLPSEKEFAIRKLRDGRVTKYAEA